MSDGLTQSRRFEASFEASSEASSDWALLRKGLWPCSVLYGLAVAVRNCLYDLGVKRCFGVDVPVVSVGNLAAGGTGKTPLVVWLVEQLRANGRHPGVLARGYGRRPGEPLNDEGLLLARRFPALPQVQDPDRVAGARRLAAHGVDLIIVDDGFQHRRLRRDRDLVCLDTARPFAGGMLPTGLLREFPRGLRRAHAMILTRAGDFSDQAVLQRIDQLRRYGTAQVEIFAADHVASRLVEMPAGRNLGLSALVGTRVHLLSGIARPASFAATVAACGAEIVDHTRRRDHHLHTVEELHSLARAAAAQDAVLVTTEKDDVKLAALPVAVVRWVVELELTFRGAAPAVDWLLPRPADRD